jgi:hypothetical protein
MKYSTIVLASIAFVAAGSVYAQNGGMEGPPDVAKIIRAAASAPHAPSKSTAPPKVVQPPR